MEATHDMNEFSLDDVSAAVGACIWLSKFHMVSSWHCVMSSGSDIWSPGVNLAIFSFFHTFKDYVAAHAARAEC